MEMSEGNSLCSYLKQTKMSGFCFVSENWRTGGRNRSFLGLFVTMSVGRSWGKCVVG
jgi:hypothetical protein